jgi:hypothetical protein
VDPQEKRRRLLLFTRREITLSLVLLAVCVGLLLGGNHDPAVVGLLVVALVVIAGDSWLRRRFR